MPKPRKTYEQADLHGSLAVNKGRFTGRRNAPPTAGTVGQAPTYFTPAQKVIWGKIVAVIPTGVAGSADIFAVEMASRLLFQFQTDPEMQASKISILRGCLSSLGLDPQARTRLLVDPAPQKEKTSAIDKFNAIVARNKALAN